MARAGYSGYLYYSETVVDVKVGGTGTDAEDIRDIGVELGLGFYDISKAIDVTPSTDRETVETTFRELARAGRKGELEIYNSGSIEFTVSSELITSDDDPIFKLIKAGIDGTDITLLDLGAQITTVGAFGTVGAYRLSSSPATPKQLKSHQILTFTAQLQAVGEMVIVTGTGDLVSIEDFSTP